MLFDFENSSIFYFVCFLIFFGLSFTRKDFCLYQLVWKILLWLFHSSFWIHHQNYKWCFQYLLWHKHVKEFGYYFSIFSCFPYYFQHWFYFKSFYLAFSISNYIATWTPFRKTILPFPSLPRLLKFGRHFVMLTHVASVFSIFCLLIFQFCLTTIITSHVFFLFSFLTFFYIIYQYYRPNLDGFIFFSLFSYHFCLFKVSF